MEPKPLSKHEGRNRRFIAKLRRAARAKGTNVRHNDLASFKLLSLRLIETDDGVTGYATAAGLAYLKSLETETK